MFTVAVISGNTVTLKARCIYYIDMELKYAIITAAAVTLLMIVGPSNAAQAYWGNWGEGDGFGNGYGTNDWGSNYGGGYNSQQSGPYNVGYQIGESQAQSDYHSDQSYQPYCGCPQHNWEYRNGYQQGYDVSWTQQKQTQNSEINIHGNNNIVGVNQEQSGGLGSPTTTESYSNDDGNGYPSNTNGYWPLSGNPECRVLCLSVR